MKPTYADLEATLEFANRKLEEAEDKLERIQKVARDYSERSSMQVAVINGILNGPENPRWP